MAWDPTQPANASALLSSPMRGNFAALDTALMAPLIAAPAQSLLKVGSADDVVAIAPGTNTHVLTMTGGAPVWQAPAAPPFPLVAPLGTATAPSYTFTGFPGTGLYGGASGELRLAQGGTLRWSISTAGHLLPAGDNLYDLGEAATKLRTIWLAGTGTGRVFYAGSAGEISHGGDLLWDASGKILNVTATGGAVTLEPARSGTTTDTNIRMNATNIGGVLFTMSAGGTGSGFGAGSFTIYNHTLGTLVQWLSTRQMYLTAAGTATRLVSHGAPDSGGAGWRQLLIQN